MSAAATDRIFDRVAERRATDAECASLNKHFARLGADITSVYPGSQPPVLANDAPPPAWPWFSWAFDAERSVECCLVQQRRSANANERAQLFVVARDGRTYRLRTRAAYARTVAGGQTMHPSLVLEGHLIVDSADDRIVFVAWQCLWLSGASRIAADDMQTRMSTARLLTDAAIDVDDAAAMLREVDDALRFAYRPHQSATQARSVLVRPLPESMRTWPVRDDALEMRAADQAGIAGTATQLVVGVDRDALERAVERLSTRRGVDDVAAAAAGDV